MIKLTLLSICLLIVMQCFKENTLNTSLLEEANPSFLSKRLDSLTIKVVADSFWVSTSPSAIHSLYNTATDRSHVMGSFSGFSSKIRYAFSLPSSFKRSLSFDVKEANLQIPRSIFSKEDSSFFKNENPTHSLKPLLVSGVLQKFSSTNNTNITTALNRFLLKETPLSFENFISIASQSSISFKDTLNAMGSPSTDSVNITNDSIIIFSSILDTTQLLDTVARDSSTWIFIELEYLNLDTTFITRSSLPTLTLITENNNILDTLEILPQIQNISFTSSTYYSRSITTHNSAFKEKSPLLLTGFDQNVHFWLNRDTILKAISQKDSNFIHSALTTSNTDFDNNYFIPYSRLHIPIDTAKTKFSSDYRLQFYLTSNLDSLYNNKPNLLQFSFKATDDTNQKTKTSVLVTSPPFNDVIDTLQLQYLSTPSTSDSTYLFVISFENNNVRSDTVLLGPNQQRSYSFSEINSSNFLYQLEFFISTKQDSVFVGAFEHFLSLLERQDTINIFNPKQDSIFVNATRGLQALFNRSLNTNQKNAFTITPFRNPVVAIDTLLTSSQIFFSEVPLNINSNNKLEVNLTIYYFQQSSL